MVINTEILNHLGVINLIVRHLADKMRNRIFSVYTAQSQEPGGRGQYSAKGRYIPLGGDDLTPHGQVSEYAPNKILAVVKFNLPLSYCML